MASVVIPSNPQINDTVVLPNKTIKWNGSVWVTVQASSSFSSSEVLHPFSMIG